MIRLIPKPEDGPPPGRSRNLRVGALAISACAVFVVFAIVLLHLLPAPHSHSDYMIVGTLATLAALITIFAGMVLGRMKR